MASPSRFVLSDDAVARRADAGIDAQDDHTQLCQGFFADLQVGIDLDHVIELFFDRLDQVQHLEGVGWFERDPGLHRDFRILDLGHRASRKAWRTVCRSPVRV